MLEESEVAVIAEKTTTSGAWKFCAGSRRSFETMDLNFRLYTGTFRQVT